MKSITIILILCIASGFIIPHALSQEIYDLNRCLATGLEKNFSFIITKNIEKTAGNNFTPGNAGLMPSLSLSGQYGGTLLSGKDKSVDNTTTETGSIHSTTAMSGVNLEMNLFNGFENRRTYQKLGKMAELGSLETRLAMENLVAELMARYHYYIQQINLYQNLAYTVSLSKERVRIDEERYRLGSASRLELLQSLVYFNADSSRYVKQREILRTSQIQLNELMGLQDPGQTWALKDTAIHILEGLIYSDLLSQTLIKNTRLLIAEQNRELTAIEAKIIQAKTFPSLSLSSGYSIYRYGYESGDLASRISQGWNYGLKMGMTLYDGNNLKRQKENSRLELINKSILYQEIQQQITAELLTVYDAYTNNLNLLRLEEQNLSVARENLEIAMERYRLGNLSGLELREVQKSLLDAEERLLSVQYQTKLAEISLHVIAGSLSEYF